MRGERFTVIYYSGTQHIHSDEDEAEEASLHQHCSRSEEEEDPVVPQAPSRAHIMQLEIHPSPLAPSPPTHPASCLKGCTTSR